MNPVILGDSSILIQEMVKKKKLKNAALGQIITKIIQQLK